VRVALNAEQLLYHSPGGVGRYTAHILSGLESFFPDDRVLPAVARHRRAEVAEAYARAGVPAELAARTALSRLPRPLLYEAWLVGPGWPPLKGIEPADVVHAPSVAVPPKPGVPLVVTVHDAAPQLVPDAFPARGRRFMRAAMTVAARRADLVIAVTATAANEIGEHSAIPAERIRVVPNAVAPPAVDAATAEAVLKKYGLQYRRYVLWVGSREPRKGAGTVVKAMAELRRRNPSAEIETVLAGYPGWLKEEIGDDDLNRLGPTLHQLGRVDEADLWCLYRGAAVFAFPSRYEGFGLPVVEAMSQGVPVVASDIPVLREVAGDAAMLVSPGDAGPWADAISALIDDEATAQRLGAAGRQRSARYSMEAMIRGTRAVYIEAGAR
jgi:glycosyltransferase involved in cell wall biosynthesis